MYPAASAFVGPDWPAQPAATKPQQGAAAAPRSGLALLSRWLLAQAMPFKPPEQCGRSRFALDATYRHRPCAIELTAVGVPQLNYLANDYVIHMAEEPGKERRVTMVKRWLVPVSLAAAALIAAGCGSGSSTPSGSGGGGSSHTPAAASGSTLKTAKIGGGTVLTDAEGFTFYWVVSDTTTKSKCNGTCCQFLPPGKGPVAPGPGVTRNPGTNTP